MSLPVVLTVEAQADFDAAADWYEERVGRGLEFTAQVRKVLDQIGAMPELHRLVYRDIRRARLGRLPYNIDYRVRPDRVEVIAMHHGRRDPSVWKGRA